MERGLGAVSLPEMRQGRIAVCQSSLAARVNREAKPVNRLDLDFATQSMAYANAQGQLSYYRVLEEAGEVGLVRSVQDLDRLWERWETEEGSDMPVGIIVSMECADPILGPDQLESWWEDGLRSVSLTHFGHGRYAAGTGVEGPLTGRGRELLSQLAQVGMTLDVSHLAEESFYGALDHFPGPVIASHNNCRALVPGDRQLSDHQIRLLLDRSAVIGLVLDAWMLVPGLGSRGIFCGESHAYRSGRPHRPCLPVGGKQPPRRHGKRCRRTQPHAFRFPHHRRSSKVGTHPGGAGIFRERPGQHLQRQLAPALSTLAP